MFGHLLVDFIIQKLVFTANTWSLESSILDLKKCLIMAEINSNPYKVRGPHDLINKCVLREQDQGQ